MSITRDDLELAALAAGHLIHGMYFDPGEDCPAFADIGPEECLAWAPHTVPSDAARLAVSLLMRVATDVCSVSATTGVTAVVVEHSGMESDALRAWCEAIVLCAAGAERLRRNACKE